MITEDYVSFEIAKLLKEKGFDSEEVGCHGGFYSERCYHSGYGIITDSGQEVGIVYDDLRNADLEYDEYLRPTLQMAIKWLREIYNIHIVLSPNKKMNNQYCSIIFVDKEGELHPQPTDFFHGSYKETAEVAIKYCLENLI